MNEDTPGGVRNRLFIPWKTPLLTIVFLVFSLILLKIMQSLFICLLIIFCTIVYFARNNPRLFVGIPFFQELQKVFPFLFGAVVEAVREPPREEVKEVIAEEKFDDAAVAAQVPQDDVPEAVAEVVKENFLPILQILDKTVQPAIWNQEEYPIVYECKLHSFRTEKVDKVMSSFTDMNSGGRPKSHHLVFLFSGKVDNNGVDVKLYRFCVKREYTARLWHYLNKATQFVPENVKQLWIEQSDPKDQDAYLQAAVNSLVDSGIESDGILMQSMLYLDERDNMWRFHAERDDDVDFIYFQTKTLPSLRSIADEDKEKKTVDANYIRNKRYLFKLARYIQKLHNHGMAHGYLSMRNALVYIENFDDTSVFLHTESFFYFEYQFTGLIEGTEVEKKEVQTARSRRKYFDGEQREHPWNFDKSCDVFAFGLFLMELLCPQSPNMQRKITRSIREYNILSEVTPEMYSEYQRCWNEFGPLLEKILVPRGERANIDFVVNYLANHLD